MITMPPRTHIAHLRKDSHNEEYQSQSVPYEEYMSEPTHHNYLECKLKPKFPEEYQPETTLEKYPVNNPKKLLNIIPTKRLLKTNEHHTSNYLWYSSSRSPANTYSNIKLQTNTIGIWQSEVMRKAQHKINNQILTKEANYTKFSKVTIQDLERICNLKPKTHQPVHQLATEMHKKFQLKLLTHRSGKQNRNRRLQAQILPIKQPDTLTFQQSKLIIIKLNTLQGE